MPRAPAHRDPRFGLALALLDGLRSALARNRSTPFSMRMRCASKTPAPLLPSPPPPPFPQDSPTLPCGCQRVVPCPLCIATPTHLQCCRRATQARASAKHARQSALLEAPGGQLGTSLILTPLSPRLGSPVDADPCRRSLAAAVDAGRRHGLQPLVCLLACLLVCLEMKVAPLVPSP